MAKKQTFLDKSARGKNAGKEYIKVVRAYKASNGAWKFKTEIVGMDESNKNEVYK